MATRARQQREAGADEPLHSCDARPPLGGPGVQKPSLLESSSAALLVMSPAVLSRRTPPPSPAVTCWSATAARPRRSRRTSRTSRPRDRRERIRTSLAAGANDEIDMEACNAGADNTCPFTHGRRRLRHLLLDRPRHSWTQPTYTGLTARDCLGAAGPATRAAPHTGPIGTLPNYDAHGLVSDGDPARRVRPAAGRERQLLLGQRLAPVLRQPDLELRRADGPFKGFEAIAVSHTDNVAARPARTRRGARR